MVQRTLFAVVNNRVTKRECTLCPLGLQRSLNSNCMVGVGEKKPLIMFVGAAPSTDDDIRGTPYTGGSGRLLHELLYEAGIKNSEIYITNAVKCASPEPKATHWEKCSAHLEDEIARIQPAAIVSIGGLAAGWLTGAKVTQSRRRSFPCKLDPTIPVYPIPQPAILFHLEGKQRRDMHKQMVGDLEWIRKTIESGAAPVKMPIDYKVAKTLEDVQAFLAEFDDVDEVCCDLETSRLGRPYADKGDHVLAIGFSKGPGHGRAIPLDVKDVSKPTYWGDKLPEVLALVKPFIQKKTLYGFNFILYDTLWTEECLGVKPTVTTDAMLLAYLKDENPPLDLQSLALRYTDLDTWKTGFNEDDPRKLGQYLCQDVDATSRLRAVLEPLLKGKKQKLFNKLLIPLCWTLRDMQWRGVRINPDKIKEFERTLLPRIESATQKLRAYSEVQAWEMAHNKFFNPGSPDQVGEIMEKYFSFQRIKSTDTGKYSTDDEVLETLIDQPFCEDLIEWRSLNKLYSTYVEKFYEKLLHDTAHTSISPTTVTGRGRSSGPNLQNIPRDDEDTKAEFPIKLLFVPRPGYIFIQADYSQIELRVLASLSGDHSMTQGFLDGLDAHTATAARVYGVEKENVTKAQRNNAKRVNFMLPYGAGIELLVARAIAAARKQARTEKKKFTPKMRREAERQAREFWDEHQRVFSGVWTYMRKQEKILERDGKLVSDTGRERHLGKADARSKRQALNYRVQSQASDITLTALVKLNRILKAAGYDAHLVLTVHDSILVEAREADLWAVAEIMREVMEGIKFDWMTVPLKVDIEAGISWGEMLKLDLAKHEFVEAA